MSVAEDKAALNVGVVAVADPTGVRGIFYRADASASNTIIALPAKSAIDPFDASKPMAGKWLNIFSSAVNLQYAFSEGAAGAALVYDQPVTAGTGHAAAGATVPTGVVFPVIIPSKARFVSIIGASASGKVELYMSEGPG